MRRVKRAGIIKPKEVLSADSVVDVAEEIEYYKQNMNDDLAQKKICYSRKEKMENFDDDEIEKQIEKDGILTFHFECRGVQYGFIVPELYIFAEDKRNGTKTYSTTGNVHFFVITSKQNEKTATVYEMNPGTTSDWHPILSFVTVSEKNMTFRKMTLCNGFFETNFDTVSFTRSSLFNVDANCPLDLKDEKVELTKTIYSQTMINVNSICKWITVEYPIQPILENGTQTTYNMDKFSLGETILITSFCNMGLLQDGIVVSSKARGKPIEVKYPCTVVFEPEKAIYACDDIFVEIKGSKVHFSMNQFNIMKTEDLITI
ncbi:hypothetical protein EIN_150790 [Entamoeba invadens IP1]|uniref:Uncharacterized protein n=1 Tax=Entamoeba invadens IP1 TaxID=370355 RepID=A0A0A1U8N0_ENTIV|nr:hypothetical protein EIN_150790 [Entamoeba invadens IP1]ELP91202.1 hypothetical protein EIN_150790 [Entamoeba invadens IP1]|eukprot:XP_004257973.1 hypothetical protein EIN_150790 [Entamoeba invadens IP1]